MRAQHKERGADIVLTQTDSLLAVNHGRCFINRLPIELLSCIFTEVFHSGIRSWEFVEHVCGSWRKIALGMPHLWTSIRVTTNLNLDKLQAELLRSGSLPLHISFYLHQDTVPKCNKEAEKKHGSRLKVSFSTLPHALRTLWPSIDRWSTLELDTSNYQYTAIFLKFLAVCPPPPRLQRLTIFGPDDLLDEAHIERTARIPFFGQARLPSLKYVDLESVQVDVRSWRFLQGLVSFSYCAQEGEILAIGSFLEIIRRSPQLEDLTLAYLYIADEDILPNPSAQFTVSCLTTLSLADMDSSSALAISGQLVLPNLRRLALNLAHSDVGDSLLQHFTSLSSGGHWSAFSRVEELELSGVRCDNIATVVAAACELQELTELKLNFEGVDDIWLYLLAHTDVITEDGLEPGIVFFPKLRSLHTQYLGPKTAIKVAQGRFKAGVPLEEFYLLDTHPLSDEECQYLSSKVGKLKLHVPTPGWAKYLQQSYEPEDDDASWDLTRYSSLRPKEQRRA